jgi:hypothetical protein
MFIFNYNGLGLVKPDTTKELKLYNSLIEKLELSDSKYTDYNMKFSTIENLIKKSLGGLSLKTLQAFKNIVGNKHSTDQQQHNIEETMRDGKNNEHKRGVEDEDGVDEDGVDEDGVDEDGGDEDGGDEDGGDEDGGDEDGGDEDGGDEEDETSDLINIMVEYLPSIIALLALFSNENGYNCESIEDCIEKCKSNIKGLGELLCRCEADESSIFACYMNQSDDNRYDSTKLIKLLDLILRIINEENESKQLAINLNVIFDNIRESMGKNNDPLIFSMESDEVLKTINKYLPVRDEEKDKFGEVFTPSALINEMLDKLPKGVWSDPTKKWLDPANGIGNFPMIVYKRLLKELPEKYDKDNIKYSDESGKSKHILKNMLYMCEINKKNVGISRRIFGPDANICCCDFLNQEDKWKKQFGVEMFDVIIGNPPFQDNVKTNDKKPRAGGKNKLYERVTISCLKLLTQAGYLLFVTPDNIMSGNSGTAYSEIIKMKTHMIGLNNIQQRYFPNIGQSMCYFLVQNKTYDDKFETSITNNDSKQLHIVLRDRCINPVREWNNETEKLFNKYITNEKNAFKRTHEGVTLTSDKNGTIQVVMNADKTINTTNNNAEGYKIIKFFLFRMQPARDGVLDSTGKFGLGQQIYYIPLTNFNKLQIEKISRFFKGNEYRKLQESTTTGQYLKDSFISHINISKVIESSNKHFSISGGKQTRKKKHNGGKHKTLKRRWSIF